MNTERQKAAQRLYRVRHPEKILEYHRQWVAEHPDYYRHYHRKWRAKNPDLASAQTTHWRKSHLGQKAEINRRREVRKRQNGVEPIVVARIIERDGMFCHLCEKVVKPDEFSLDHVLPIARGGRHCESNVRVAHRRCNSRRGARLLEIPSGLGVVGGP